MLIPFAPKHHWYKDVMEKPELLFGDKNRKRILSTIPKVDDHNISYELAQLDQSFLNWFTPVYINAIGAKPNAMVHNLYEATIGNIESLSEYWSFTLYQNNEILGATIFGIREDRIMIAFKTYQQKWLSGTLQANPTLYSEYILAKFAHDKGKELMSHGTDRNPYGINAGIGLATFKLSTGYRPSVPKTVFETGSEIFDTSTISEDVLLLHFPESEQLITEATLFTTPEAVDTYTQLLRYPERLHVHVSYWGE